MIKASKRVFQEEEDPFEGIIDQLDYVEPDILQNPNEREQEEAFLNTGEPTFLEEEHHGSEFQLTKITESDILPKPYDKEREEGLVKIGEPSFLGDGHHGSPRHLAKLAMNSLTIVSELGKPTFFLTLTCNHMWPEVQSRLFPGQSAFDREDVIDIFHMY